MVRKPDIQYIRCYTDGSSARVLQPVVTAPKTRLPKLRRKKALVIRLDPLAYVGLMLSAVMLVLMIVSCVQLADIQKKTDRMVSYVDTLKEENARLSDTYRSNYDLQDVERKALAMGMVPIEQVRRIQVTVTPAAQDEEPPKETFWAFLTGVFE